MADITQSRITALTDAVSNAFAAIENALVSQVFTEVLPLVGDKLHAEWLSNEGALHHIDNIKTAVLSAISSLSTSGDLAEETVEAAINGVLGIYGTSVDAIVTGPDVTLNFNSAKSYSYTQSLASDFGMDLVKLETAGSATATLQYAFNLTVGADATGGYVATSGANELSVNFAVTAAEVTADATLGFLNFNATTSNDSTLTANFSVNLKDTGAGANGDGLLRVSELGTDILDATVQGGAHIDVHLAGDMGTAALPSISADLLVDWQFSAGTVVNPSDTNATFGDKPIVSLNNVSYDLGSFVENVIQPILDTLEPILKPLNVALSILNTDIKALKILPGWEQILDKTGAVNELGEEVGDHMITILDIVKAAQPGLNLAPLINVMNTIDQVIDWVEFFTDRDFGPESYSLGDFSLGADIRDAAFLLENALPTLSEAGDDLYDVINGLTGDGWGENLPGSDLDGGAVVSALLGSPTFSFPIIENPMTAIGLLLGQTVDLVGVQLPHVSLDVANMPFAAFPVFPGIEIALDGGISLDFDLGAGFDTRGLQQFADNYLAHHVADYGLILNGFYLNDFDGNGDERPEITFAVTLGLTVGLDAIIAELRGGGYVTGEIMFDLADALWSDGAPAGRIYLTDMAAAIADNPFSIFETSGSIVAGLTAYAKVFGVEVWRVNSPRLTLGPFSFDGTPSLPGASNAPQPGLGDLSGNTLLVNIGDRAGERDISDKTDDGESIEIGIVAGAVVINGFGYQQSFSGVTHITANGGEADDEIVVGDTVTIATTISGGNGDDTLLGGAVADTLYGDADRDYLDGAAGDDELHGGSEDDILVGGAGADEIYGDAGRDIVSYFSSAAGVTVNLRDNTLNAGGDAAGDILHDVEVVEGSGYADSLTGATGNESLVGLGGDDSLFGGDGNDVLSGNGGNDFLTGGLGQDIMIGGLGDDTYSVDDLGDDIRENGLNEIAANVNGGNDTVIASIDYTLNYAGDADHGTRLDIENLVLAGGARVGIGNALANTIAGTTGDDFLYGLAGADRLVGMAGHDTLEGGLNNDILEGGDGNDTLRGGADDDSLTGGADNDKLYGDGGVDSLIGGAGDDELDGGLGIDTLTGGLDNDIYYVDTASDVIVEIDGQGTDSLVASSSYDLAAAVSVEFLTAAEGTAAIDLAGNAFNQVLVGNDGDNVLEGRGGADLLSGGLGTDVATYRSAAAGVTIDLSLAAQVGGDAGGDIYDGIEIVEGSQHGDAFYGTSAGGEHFRGLGGVDILYGGGGADTLDGGSGNDFLHGDAGNDTLIGGTGDDTYYVDSLSDVIVEDDVSSAGTQDHIITGIDYSLFTKPGIEWLTITGSARHATGNGSGNTIWGTAFDDFIDGATGVDLLIGGNGNDTYYLDRMGDEVVETANQGHDTLIVAVAQLTFASQSIPDPIVDYTMQTWAANVEDLTLDGNQWRVNIEGNALNNRIETNTRDSITHGNGGDDTLVGHGVSDQFFGDEGNDRAEWVGVDGVNYHTSFDGGAGLDTLKLDMSLVAYGMNNDNRNGTLAAGYGGYFNNQYNSSSSNSFSYAGVERFELSLGFGNDSLFLGDGNDIVNTNAGDDVIRSGMGADIIDGGKTGVERGTDRWAADKSDATVGMTIDLMVDTASAYIVNGVQGSVTGIEGLGIDDNFRFDSGSGDDVISTRGEFITDLIDTNGGNDRVTVRGGQDNVTMGEGLDTLVLDYRTLDYGFNTGWQTGSLAAGYNGVFNNQYNSSSSTRVDFGGVERFELYLGSGNDDFRTGDGNDIISTAAGDDLIRSGKGFDIIDGGGAGAARGTDRWAADKSDATVGMTIDLMVETASTYLINGVQGSVIGVEGLGIDDNYRFASGSGDDVISTRGEFITDLIDTNAGNDRVTVRGGIDNVTMGHGLDTLVLDYRTVDFGLNTGWQSGTLAAGYDGIFNNQYNSSSTTRVSFTGVERFELYLGSGNDDFRTGDGNDIISTAGGDDLIRTGKGFDIVDGGGIGAARGVDRWAADKSDATVGMTIDLMVDTASTYEIDGVQVSVIGIEGLGIDDNYRFASGSGDDVISTRGEFITDLIDTNAGDDRVTVRGGIDNVTMGNGLDTLVLDYSTVDFGLNTGVQAGTFATGYDGIFNNQFNSSSTTRVSFTGVERFELYLGSGYDDFRTGDGNDIISTAAGDDLIRSGKGVDTVDGGNTGLTRGTDRWAADKSAATVGMTIDLMVETASTYEINGVQGSVTGIEGLGIDDNYRFASGSGADVISTRGEFITDLIDTNGGNDRVTVRGGIDNVTMGEGLDTLVIDYSTLDYGFNTGVQAGTFAAGYDGFFNNQFNSSSSTRVSFTGVERFELTFGTGADGVTVGDGNDIVRTGGADDWMRTGKGADVIDGGAGTADRWSGDKSAATTAMIIDLRAASSSYMIGSTAGSVAGIEALGWSSDERFMTGSGNDTVTTLGNLLNDFIDLGAGDDRAVFAGGRDDVVGGSGFDTLVVDWSSVTDYGFNNALSSGSLATGYTGNFNNSYNSSSLNYLAFDGIERFELSLSQQGDNFTTGDGNDIVSTNGGNDWFITGKGADVVDGGAGIDTWGADKSDATGGMVIDLTAASSTYVVGGITGSVTGIEALGYDGSTKFLTGSGNDVITTRSDYLTDYLVTGAGDDRVTLAGGRDDADLGSGSDTLVLDYSALDYGLQRYSFDGSLAAGYNGYFQNQYNSSSLVGVVFAGVERFEIRLGSGHDNIETGDGDDILRGGLGNDTLSGAGGADLLAGEGGNDTLIGGDGADILVYESGEVTINDFALGIDQLKSSRFAGFDSIDDLLAFRIEGGNPAHAVFEFSAGNRLTLLNVDWEDLTEADLFNTDPTITSNLGGATASISIPENAAVVTTVVATDADAGDVLTYSISGGDDAAWFEIDEETGELRFTPPADYEGPNDTGSDNVYEVIVTASDALGASDSQTLTVTVTDLDDNSAPVITFQGGTATATLNVAENTATSTVIATVAASDGENDPLSYVLSGDDAQRFTIDTATGALRFAALPDFETPADDDGDNIYRVTVTVDDGQLSDTQDLVVTVTNVLGATPPATNGNNVLTGTAEAETINGLDGIDTLRGLGGNDVLNGGLKNDRMEGGMGDDTYYVDNAGDVVVELFDQGIDMVISTINYVLTANVENLVLSGAAAIRATGNGLANRLTGTSGNNILNGAGGLDTMLGGVGNDTYNVDLSTDVVTELAGQGTDTVISTAATYTLALNVENLTLGGAGAISGNGNGGVNTITGNAAANTLYGAGGTDKLIGGAGNDTYVLENGADVITDTAGIDTITSTITRSLASYATIERLTLLGTANINATGNGAANLLTGNDGNNVISGGIGADTMAGGLGNDTMIGGLGRDIMTGGVGGATNRDLFDFNLVTESGVGVALRDIITDFTKGEDRIDLSTIDAIAGGANNAFGLLARGTAASAVGTGKIGWYFEDLAGTANDKTIIKINSDADAAIEMTIELKGLVSLAVTDFVL